MNAKQKKFILEKLIPFIMREQGRGFMMADWVIRRDGESPLKKFVNSDLNGKLVTWPKCDTVCCIGGSAEILLKIPVSKVKADVFESRLGLSYPEQEALFYKWSGNSFEEFGGEQFCWPKKFKLRFSKAKTPASKAKVACDLLKEVVKTEGKCLYRKV